MKRAICLFLDVSAITICAFLFLPTTIYTVDKVGMGFNAAPLLAYGLGASIALLIILSIRSVLTED